MNQEQKDLEEVVMEKMEEAVQEEKTVQKKETVENKEAVQSETIPSMKEFDAEINHSFKKLNEGDLLRGTVIGVSDTEVTVDLNYYTEGIIKLEELSNDPRFSIKADILPGEEITAMVLGENKEGNILLSRKKADDVLAWTTLKELMAEKTLCTVKVQQVVKGGVVTYLNGIRAFIPASQLGLNYVEDLEEYTGKELEVIVITVDEENKKLVLSAKEPAKEKALSDKKSRIARLQKGIVTTGIVDKIMPFGAFVKIGDALSGLLHISQISAKRIKSPNEAIKEGEEVTVKIIDIKDGKISLSMKAVQEQDEVTPDAADTPASYTSDGDVSTGLGSLLKNIKLPE